MSKSDDVDIYEQSPDDPLDPILERLANPISGLDLMARLVQEWSDDPSNPNVSAWLKSAAQELRDAMEYDMTPFIYTKGT